MAYKIVNNNIHMSRGETPTYNVAIINRETGAPYIIVERINNPYIEFVVRPSIYSRENDFVFKLYIDTFDKHKFPTTEVVDYTGSVWDDAVAPNIGDEHKLHRRTVAGVSDFAYYDNNQWILYEFRISFQFPYSSTSVMESKTYKYEVTLFGGNLKENIVVGEMPLIIDYKEPLLEASDFVVGGSLSE